MNLKQKLDFHYKTFDKSSIEPDPLQFLHNYTKRNDIEASGFIASVFAYGNVTQIINTLKKIFKASGKGPYNFVLNYNTSDYNKIKDIKHRFYTSEDIDNFFRVYKKVLRKWDTLENLFVDKYSQAEKNIKTPLNFFSGHFISQVQNPSPGFSFMFPVPEKGSSCKRMNLFLRWMVRKDELDFGLWEQVSPSKLVIPVDTHIARICRQLGLTTKKNVSWRMAEEITDNLRKFDPYDPVKYDFAICHIGIRKLKL